MVLLIRKILILFLGHKTIKLMPKSHMTFILRPLHFWAKVHSMIIIIHHLILAILYLQFNLTPQIKMLLLLTILSSQISKAYLNTNTTTSKFNMGSNRYLNFILLFVVTNIQQVQLVFHCSPQIIISTTPFTLITIKTDTR